MDGKASPITTLVAMSLEALEHAHNVMLAVVQAQHCSCLVMGQDPLVITEPVSYTHLRAHETEADL
eukprot:2705539-Amphidinium_carterae.1